MIVGVYLITVYKTTIAAVLKLDHPFKENKFRQTIHLTEQPDYLEENHKDINNNSQLTVLGWGTLSQGGLSAKKLHHVNVPYIPHRLCQTSMVPHKVFKGMLCAGDLKKVNLLSYLLHQFCTILRLGWDRRLPGGQRWSARIPRVPTTRCSYGTVNPYYRTDYKINSNHNLSFNNCQ